MDIYKIALLGMISAILIIALKDQVPVFTVIISIVTGVLIILYVLPQIKEVVLELKSLVDYAEIPDKYIKILLKVIGISYISIFSSEICKDFGQANISEKINFNNILLYASYIRFSRKYFINTMKLRWYYEKISINNVICYHSM